MRPGMGKVFKQILDAQAKAARDVKAAREATTTREAKTARQASTASERKDGPHSEKD